MTSASLKEKSYLLVVSQLRAYEAKLIKKITAGHRVVVDCNLGERLAPRAARWAQISKRDLLNEANVRARAKLQAEPHLLVVIVPEPSLDNVEVSRQATQAACLIARSLKISIQVLATEEKTKLSVFSKQSYALSARIQLADEQNADGDFLQLRDAINDTGYQNLPKAGGIYDVLRRRILSHGLRAHAISDDTSGNLSAGRTLLGINLLSSLLRPRLAGHKSVAIMLPTSVASALSFLALMHLDKTAVIINFTAGSRNVQHGLAISDCDVIVTSRRFIEKAGLSALAETLTEKHEIIYLEDIRAQANSFTKIKAALAVLRPGTRDTAVGERIACILFTSGTEGKPKAVALSHRNILSNVAQVASTIGRLRGESLFSPLPVFHCFGLTVGTILPLYLGVATRFYPSPTHSDNIVDRIRREKPSILIGTDNFLRNYGRRAKNNELASIKLCVGGAEPLSQKTREYYGGYVIEGYGATEASPVIAINCPLANRPGSVGRALPQIALSSHKVDGLEHGTLIVTGPNVMHATLSEAGLVASNGSYDTGDVVSKSLDGFITIVGRLKRFAKLGGEMVSLAAIEAAVHELYPNHTNIVVAVADEKKGERIILVTDNQDLKKSDLAQKIAGMGYPAIYIPARVQRLEQIAMLASGKPDYRAIEEIIGARSDPQVSDPQVGDPQMDDPQVSDPQVSDPQVSDPQVSDPQVSDRQRDRN